MRSIPSPEIQFIRDAAGYLETPNLIHRLSQIIGKPIDKGLERLPDSAKQMIHQASQKAVEAALRASLATLGESPSKTGFREAVESIPQRKLVHGAGSALTGA